MVARAGADLEHLVAGLHVYGIGHARREVRVGDGHPVPDVEVVMFVGAAEILLGDEFFTRGEQVGTDIALVPDVAVGDEPV